MSNRGIDFSMTASQIKFKQKKKKERPINGYFFFRISCNLDEIQSFISNSIPMFHNQYEFITGYINHSFIYNDDVSFSTIDINNKDFSKNEKIICIAIYTLNTAVINKLNGLLNKERFDGYLGYFTLKNPSEKVIFFKTTQSYFNNYSFQPELNSPYDTLIENDDNSNSHSADIVSKAVTLEYVYSMIGLLLGLVSLIGGIVLAIRGIAGATSWTTSFLGLSSEINDAPPGVILFIVGVFIVFITKPKVKLNKLEG